MSAMRPAERHRNGEELWDRVLAHAGIGPEDDDPFREELLRRVVPALARRLTGVPGVAALAAKVDADEDDDGWYGAVQRAAQLGWNDDTSRLALWMLSEKTTSGEADSPYFHAMGAAAADLVDAAIPALGIRAAALYALHRDLLMRFVDAQRDLTAALLNELSDVPLHRGDVLRARVPGTPIDPSLWPLASFAVDFETAASFAHRKAGRVGGTPVVYSAFVPIDALPPPRRLDSRPAVRRRLSSSPAAQETESRSQRSTKAQSDADHFPTTFIGAGCASTDVTVVG